MILQGYIITSLYMLLVIVLTLVIRRKLTLPDEIYRKFLHISISFAWPIMYYTLGATIHMFILISVGLVATLIAMKFGVFNMLGRGEEKHLLGIALFPVSICIMIGITQLVPGSIYACGIGIFALSFGDGFAALIGKRLGKYTPKLYANKSVAGTVACIVFGALGMALVSFMMGHTVAAWKLLLLGVMASIIELFSGDWDNIAIPVPVMIVAYLVNA